MTTLTFQADSAWGRILLDWWRELPNDTGGRATLRRAPDLTAVVMQPAFQRLRRRLLTAGWPDEPWRNDRLAAAAGLLAQVREHAEGALPAAMSQSDGDKPRVSPLRFQRLLESPDVDALFTGLRRTLPLLQHRADVLAIANDLLLWGDGVRKRWAFGYDWPEVKKAA
jgi:CRISPR system Cascade subunit CasB